MKEELRMHAFVCVNERDSNNQRGCCSSKNSLEVMTKLKRKVREMGIDDVRINKSGCLNRCEEGIACVIYPQGIWYKICLLYTSPSPRDRTRSRMPSSA